MRDLEQNSWNRCYGDFDRLHLSSVLAERGDLGDDALSTVLAALGRHR